MANALRFKSTQVPRQPGELARLKVVRGPDYGALYIITGKRASIGRGEENDVVVSDLKASRRHAEVLYSPGGWEVRDAGSANGILYNGTASKGSRLKTADTFSLGETTLEFVGAEQGTQMLVAPAKTLEQVEQAQRAAVARDERIQSLRMPEMFRGQSGAAPGAKKAGINPKILLLVLGGAALFFIDGEDEKPKARKPASTTEAPLESRDLASFLPDTPEANLGKSAEMFYRAGYREYRQGNWLRAKVQFETVLQVQPAHSLAKIYLQNSNKNIEREVQEHLDLGRKDLDAGKLKSARGHFEAVQRLLFRDQSNAKLVEAKELLEKLKAQAEGRTI
jgi:pSer/pThr/pTyr-binding forkhead associated (FHA) protein